MAIRKQDLNSLVCQQPQRPEPVTLVAQVDLDDIDWNFPSRAGRRHQIIEQAKRELALQLLDGIIAKCFPYAIEAGLADFIDRKQPLRMEVTLHDRGSYEHWIPRERSEARREGYKDGAQAVRQRLPHGIDIDRVEE